MGEARAQPRRPDYGWAVLLLFAIFWIFLLGQAEDTPLAKVLLLDELWYLDRAATAAEAPHFMTPLYPALLKMTGLSDPVPVSLVQSPAALRPVRLLQMLCWFGTVVLLRLTAGRLLRDLDVPDRATAFLVWLPPLLFALYAPAAVYTLTLLVETPLVFLVTLFLYLTLRGREQPRLLLAAGLAVGVAALLRGTVGVLLPLAIWVGWSRLAGRRRWLGLGLLLLAVAVPLAVPSVQNSRVAGRPAGPTLNGGLNFYIGNGPEANGFYMAPADLDWRNDPAGVGILRDRFGRPTESLPEADLAWWTLGAEAVREAPARFAGLWIKKVWLHLQAWEIDQLTPLSGWRNQAPLLRGLPVPWTVLVILGLTGVLAHRRPAVRLLLWAGGTLIAAQSLFFVVSRYRLVLAPVLALLALAGVAVLWAAWRDRRAHLPVGALGALLVGILVSLPWELADTRARWAPLIQANEGRRWAVLGEHTGSDVDLARAETLYRAAVDQRPDSAEPWLGLAAVLAARGDRPGARQVLRDAEAVLPAPLEARKMRLALLLSDGHRSDALELARLILADHPRDADTLHNASVLLAGFGNAPAAIDMARRLLEAYPDDPQGAVDLGVLLARSGDRAGAAEVFRQGLRRNPGHRALMRNLDLVTPDP